MGQHLAGVLVGGLLDRSRDPVSRAVDEDTKRSGPGGRDCQRVCGRALVVDVARKGVEASTAAWTALADALGYERAQEISRLAREEGKSVREAALAHGGLTEAEFEELIAPDSVTRLGSPPPEEKE